VKVLHSKFGMTQSALMDWSIILFRGERVNVASWCTHWEVRFKVTGGKSRFKLVWRSLILMICR